MAVLADVGPLGHTATPSQDCGRISDCCDFQEEAKASEGRVSPGVGLRKNIFKEGVSQFGKTVSLAIARFVFNFSPRSLFIKSERKKYFLKFPPEIFGSLGFVLCTEQCRPRLARRASARGGAAAHCPSLCFLRIPCPGWAAGIDLKTEGLWKPVSQAWGERAGTLLSLGGK